MRCSFVRSLVSLSFLCLLSVSSSPLVWAQAVLENPQPGSFQSGVGVISGWVCEAERVEIVFENGVTAETSTVPASYGTIRTDTQEVCGDSNNGFGLLFNWNKFGDGRHTVRVLSDGVEFAFTTITVTTLGEEFRRGVSGEFTLSNFPEVGTDVVVRWQESQQNFVITDGSSGGGDGTSGRPPRVLENPQPGSFQSGVGVISGWVCDANQIEIEFNNDAANRWPAGSGTQRTDTQDICGDTNNGFGLLFNWNKLGAGTHTVRALADGTEFARATVTVTTLGEEFRRGVSGEFTLSNFPEVGTDVVVRWQESQQNFVMAEVRSLQVYIPPVYTHALFVDGAVATSGDGTQARPFKTIQEAIKVALPSTAIRIAAGRYNESVVVYKKDSIGLFGAARDTVTISNPGGFGVLCNTGNEVVLHSMTITGKNGIGMLACAATFANIVVTKSSQRAGIIVANFDPSSPATASSLTLYNAQVIDNPVGVEVNDTSSFSAYGTAFNHNMSDGIRVTSSGTVTLDACDLSENGRDGFNWKNANSDPGRLRMARSTISNNERAGIILLNAVNGSIDGSHIIGNGHGARPVNGLEFYFSWQETFTISNSTFMDNASFGIFIASGTVTLENNVIDGNGQNGLGVYHGCDGDYGDCSSLPIEVVLRDNIIRNHQGTNENDGIGLTLAQYMDPPINIILDGGNEFYNNRNHHVGCASPTNWLNLTCEEPVFSSNDVKLISTCAVYGVCSAAACSEFCQ